jgi:hypothetical protein
MGEVMLLCGEVVLLEMFGVFSETEMVVEDTKLWESMRPQLIRSLDDRGRSELRYGKVNGPQTP